MPRNGRHVTDSLRSATIRGCADCCPDTARMSRWLCPRQSGLDVAPALRPEVPRSSTSASSSPDAAADPNVGAVRRGRTRRRLGGSWSTIPMWLATAGRMFSLDPPMDYVVSCLVVDLSFGV